MIRIEIDAQSYIRALERFADTVERDLDILAQQSLLLALRRIQQGWPVDSGISRLSWSTPRRRGPRDWEIINTARYAAVIEFGGYPGVGPKTVALGGEQLPGDIRIASGIFPSQRPSAPVRRSQSAAVPEIRRDVEQVLRRAWRLTA